MVTTGKNRLIFGKSILVCDRPKIWNTHKESNFLHSSKLFARLHTFTVIDNTSVTGSKTPRKYSFLC